MTLIQDILNASEGLPLDLPHDILQQVTDKLRGSQYRLDSYGVSAASFSILHKAFVRKSNHDDAYCGSPVLDDISRTLLTTTSMLT